MHLKEAYVFKKKIFMPIAVEISSQVKVERVTEYKYLGTVLDYELTFNAN